MNTVFPLKNNASQYISISFRQAVPEDAAAILALYRSAVGRPFCAWDDEYPGQQEIDADLACGGLYVLVNEGRIIGAASAAAENELDDLSCWSTCKGTREIARIVIAPEHQGQGLASVLVSSLLGELHHKGCSVVHLAAAKENTPACRTYLHLGFVIVGEAEMWGHSYWLMEKE